MSIYQVSGNIVSINNDYSTANISASDSVNPITGVTGVNVVKITNTDANVTNVNFTSFSTTYLYPNKFAQGSTGVYVDITATRLGYDVSLVSSNEQPYIVGDQFIVPGNELGGIAPDNTCVIGVTSVSNGAVTGIEWLPSGCTAVWPQSSDGTLYLTAKSTEFVQVNSGRMPEGCWFQCAGQANVTLIQPVSIVSSN